MSNFIPGIAQFAEQTLLGYVSSSLAVAEGGLVPQGLDFYAGIADEDKAGPAVVIAAESADEVYFNSRVYRVNVNVLTKEMAADSVAYDTTNTGSMISLAGNVNAMFGDSLTACGGINTYSSASAFTQNAPGLYCYQVQVRHVASTVNADAWISAMNLDLICGIVAGYSS